MSDDTLHDGRPRVGSGWIGLYGLLYLALNIAWSAPSQLLIANQVLRWHPEDKEGRLALVMLMGGAASVVAGPVWGYLSDRTRSRFGQRAPWIVGGALVAAASLVALGLAPGYAYLVAGWTVFQIAIAAAINASLAVPADMVSRSQFGIVSGVMGIAYTLALVLGTILAESVGIELAYFLSAALLLVGITPFLVRYRAPRVMSTPVPQVPQVPEAPELPEATSDSPSAAAQLPGRHGYGDFIWVFVSRLAATLGNTVALFYLLYYLRDRIRVSDPDGSLLTLTLIYAVCAVAASITSGHLSDRVGRRRPFVAAGALGVSAACVIMVFARDFTTVIVAAVILGLAWGVFTAVDQALINQVLPDGATRGRDVSIMATAVVLPNMLAPIVAAGTLLYVGGYPGLYVTAAVLSALGAVTVAFVKGSR